MKAIRSRAPGSTTFQLLQLLPELGFLEDLGQPFEFSTLGGFSHFVMTAIGFRRLHEGYHILKIAAESYTGCSRYDIWASQRVSAALISKRNFEQDLDDTRALGRG